MVSLALEACFATAIAFWSSGVAFDLPASTGPASADRGSSSQRLSGPDRPCMDTYPEKVLVLRFVSLILFFPVGIAHRIRPALGARTMLHRSARGDIGVVFGMH